MRITWLGHACYLIENSDGKKLAIDPFDPSIGYDPPNVSADLVTKSHEHHDHNAIDQLRGEPIVISALEETTHSGYTIKSIPSFHDDFEGEKRGKNKIFVYQTDDLKLVHLGDLGHILDNETVKLLGKVDILFVPVGGVYTLDGEKASQLVDKIKAKVTIPMHYKTNKLNIELNSVDDFLNLQEEYQQSNTNFVDISRDNIDSYPSILVLSAPK